MIGRYSSRGDRRVSMLTFKWWRDGDDWGRMNSRVMCTVQNTRPMEDANLARSCDQLQFRFRSLQAVVYGGACEDISLLARVCTGVKETFKERRDWSLQLTPKYVQFWPEAFDISVQFSRMDLLDDKCVMGVHNQCSKSRRVETRRCSFALH